MQRPALAVTNVDSALGHSIVRNISFRPIRNDVRVCGLMRGAGPFGGEHLCDTVMDVSSIRAPDDLAELCVQEGISLIIPTTEEEIVALKEVQHSLPFVLASSLEVSKMFRDKLLTARAFGTAEARFCSSLLPSEYVQQPDLISQQIIVKPRRGEHSRGVLVNPPNVEEFSDEDYIVQPLMTGREVTTAVYYRAEGSFHGSISLIRRFVPQGSVYEVTREFDSQVAAIAKRLRSTWDIVGSINVQSIVVDGQLVPFEVNGRISGSNVIRAEFGFPDVQWAIEEYLLDREPAPPTIRSGSAVTTRVDAIFPNATLAEVGTSRCMMIR